MKITKAKLKQIIKEELSRALMEVITPEEQRGLEMTMAQDAIDQNEWRIQKTKENTPFLATADLIKNREERDASWWDIGASAVDDVFGIGYGIYKGAQKAPAVVKKIAAGGAPGPAERGHVDPKAIQQLAYQLRWQAETAKKPVDITPAHISRLYTKQERKIQTDKLNLLAQNPYAAEQALERHYITQDYYNLIMDQTREGFPEELKSEVQ